MVYNYFHNCCSLVNLLDNDLELKKKALIFQRLSWKKVLKSLKANKMTSITEMKYVSCLLSGKLRKEDQPHAFNYNEHIKENYWKYCKNHFKTNQTVLPAFGEDDCWKHFMKTCHEPKPSKVFNIPSSMKQLEELIKDFNNKPPTYNEINKITMKMKSSGSSCPID